MLPPSKRHETGKTRNDHGEDQGTGFLFPIDEKTYGHPIAHWQDLVRKHYPARHMDLVSMLKAKHGMGHGHANAIVAHTLAADLQQFS